MKTKSLLKNKNYILMLVGIAMLIIGFILISGGNEDDWNKFSYEIFNFRRLFIGPMFILLGFVVQIFAIMYRGKDEKE